MTYFYNFFFKRNRVGMESKKITVTVGADFIESNIVWLLLRVGHSIEVAETSPEKLYSKGLKNIYSSDEAVRMMVKRTIEHLGLDG